MTPRTSRQCILRVTASFPTRRDRFRGPSLIRPFVPDVMQGMKIGRKFLRRRTLEHREEQRRGHIIVMGQQQDLAQGPSHRGENEDPLGSAGTPGSCADRSYAVHGRYPAAGQFVGQPGIRIGHTVARRKHVRPGCAGCHAGSPQTAARRDGVTDPRDTHRRSSSDDQAKPHWRSATARRPA